MFSFKKAFVREIGPRSLWVEKDVSGEQMIDLYNNYQAVTLVLTNPLYESDIAVDLNEIPTYLKAKISQETLAEFLVRIDNAGLPMMETVPELSTSDVIWMDGFRAGYQIDLAHPTIDFSVDLDRSDKTDIRITKEGVDPKRLFDECIFTVNGLIHKSNFIGDAVHLMDGGRTNRVSNKNQLGILYFGNIGTVKEVPIKEENVSAGLRGQPLKEAVFLDINKEVGDLTNKSVLLSIGGYLLIPEEDYFYRVGDGVYKLEFRNQPWLQRYYDSKKRTCMACLDKHLSKSTVNPSQVSIEEFYSDEVITAMMTQLNSFFIVIDSPNLNFEKEYLEFGEMPGHYVSYEEPKLPLVTDLGVLSEYWYKKEYDRYSLSTIDTLNPNYLFETTDWKTGNSVDDSKVTSDPYNFTKGFMLRIFKQELK